jgi:hypothetical protein
MCVRTVHICVSAWIVSNIPVQLKLTKLAVSILNHNKNQPLVSNGVEIFLIVFSSDSDPHINIFLTDPGKILHAAPDTNPSR